MSHDRKPLSRASRVFLAVIILAIFPLSAVQAEIACSETVYWNGSNLNAEQGMYYWQKDSQGKTNWYDLAKNKPNIVLLTDASIVFPDGVVNKHATNDFSLDRHGDGWLVYNIKFDNSSGYLIDGKPIQLANGIKATAATGSNTIDTDIELTADQEFFVDGTSTLIVSGALSDIYGNAVVKPASTDQVDCNYGITLTKTGSGTLALTAKDNTFTGSIRVANGTLMIGPHVTAGLLWLNSSNKPQTTSDASNKITLSVRLDSATDFSRAVVSGSEASVNLNNATLDLSSANLPLDGHPFTIIDNQGKSSVEGTFLGIKDGGLVRSREGYWFTVSYTGGSKVDGLNAGNDVVLTPYYLPLYLPKISRFASPDAY